MFSPNPFEVAFVFNGLPEDKFQSSISISITQNMMVIWSTHFYIEVPFLHCFSFCSMYYDHSIPILSKNLYLVGKRSGASSWPFSTMLVSQPILNHQRPFSMVSLLPCPNPMTKMCSLRYKFKFNSSEIFFGEVSFNHEVYSEQFTFVL